MIYLFYHSYYSNSCATSPPHHCPLSHHHCRHPPLPARQWIAPALTVAPLPIVGDISSPRPPLPFLSPSVRSSYQRSPKQKPLLLHSSSSCTSHTLVLLNPFKLSYSCSHSHHRILLLPLLFFAVAGCDSSSAPRRPHWHWLWAGNLR